MRYQEVSRLLFADKDKPGNKEIAAVGLVPSAFVLAFGVETDRNARRIGLVDVRPLLAAGRINLYLRRIAVAGRVGNAELLDLVRERIRREGERGDQEHENRIS